MLWRGKPSDGKKNGSKKYSGIRHNKIIEKYGGGEIQKTYKR